MTLKILNDMKKLCSLLVTVLIFSALFSSCFAQMPKTRTNNDSIQLKAQELKELYFKATNSPGISDIYKRHFFDAFPNTFNALNRLYGDTGDTIAILSGEALNHINYLFNDIGSVVNDTIYYRKIISIAMGGHWDADAINYFQQGLRNQVLAKPELVAYLLKGMPDKQMQSFWYFYFDSPYPDKEIPEKLSVIKEADTHMYSLMEATLKDVQQSWKDK